jgi:hypothetical protein
LVWISPRLPIACEPNLRRLSAGRECNDERPSWPGSVD